jgi:uncharacterized membrane protein
VVNRQEPRWPAALAVVAALLLQLVLPEKLNLPYTRWVIPATEAALLVALLVTDPYRDTEETRVLRVASILLIGLTNLGNVISLGLLIDYLLYGGPHGQQISGRPLILSGFAIWLTLILVFGLWYWEFDRGGPARRGGPPPYPQPDLQFPQDVNADLSPDWCPAFMDYLYVSFTNATAFSPTDTMPLSRWTKSMFLVQALASVMTLGLVVARAVNILKG